MTKVFIIPFQVGRLTDSIMPEGMVGAFVSCYAAGDTYIDAAERALQKLSRDGLHPEKILQPVHQMELSDWSAHILDLWPTYINSLPDQNEFEDIIKEGRVVYGPFASYS